MKLRVGVLMGGPSEEYEVSLSTGERVLAALAESSKFTGTALVLSEDLKLKTPEEELDFPDGFRNFDIIFNALHGKFGEDGQIQYILDNLGVPYTGSGVEASSAGMDKWVSNEIFKKGGLDVPEAELVVDDFKNSLSRKFPVVVKPRSGGSSLGIFVVKDRMDLARRIKDAKEFDDELIIEKYIAGREFTGSVLEAGGKLRALPVVEIKPLAGYEFFDYEAKYKEGASQEIAPAVIEPELTLKIQKAAILAHKLLGCRIYSRTDFLWDGVKLYVLELNTLPGLTENSLMPKSAKAAGITFPKLIEMIIEASLRGVVSKGAGTQEEGQEF